VVQWIPPPPWTDIQRVNLDDFATGKAVGKHPARRTVFQIVESRHHDTSVHEIEIDVACRKQPAAPVRPHFSRLRNFYDFDLPPFSVSRVCKPAFCFRHGSKIRMGPQRRNSNDHPSRRGETGDVVDMSVGFFVRKTTAEP